MRLYSTLTTRRKGIYYSRTIFASVGLQIIWIFSGYIIPKISILFIVKIKSINKNEIRIQVIDELSEFYNNIDVPLYELNFDADDYYFNFASYTSMRSNLSRSVLYPVIDNRGYNLASSNVLIDAALNPDLQYFRHSYLVKNILTKIIESQGYNADLTIMDNDLLITSNHKDFYFTDYQLSYVAQAVTAGNYPTNAGATLEITSQSNFLQAVGLYEWLFIAAQSKMGIEIELEEDAYLQVLKRDGGGFPTYISETHFVDGSAKLITDYYQPGNQIGFQFDRDVNITSLRIVLLTNEVDYYMATGVAWTNGDVGVVGWQRNATGLPYKYLLEDYYIKSSYNLPEITQKKLFLEFFKISNTFLEFEGGTIVLKRNELGDPVEIKAASSPKDTGKIKLAQNNFMKYMNDSESDFIFPQFAEFNKHYENDFDIESDLIQINSSASIDVRNTDQNPADYFNVAKVPIYDGITNIEDDRLEQSMRFLLLSDSISGTSIAADYELVFQVGLTENLNFENIYDLYYKDYYDYLNNAKTRIIQAHLTIRDFLRVRESGVVYYDGREYIVLQIGKFNPERLTELKVISREVNNV